jgi:5'-phosphate synthase pdxT subunit
MSSHKPTIGVLALQGDFERHQSQLTSLGIDHQEVKLPLDLGRIDGLIIPGGESTTMDLLIDRFDLRQPLREFGRKKPIYGTCAGMIMLAKGIENNISGISPLGLLDIDVLRNGYGRQVFSFEEDIPVSLSNGTSHVRACFIRAPRVTRYGEDITVLASFRDEPVMVLSGNILASSFHTELEEEPTILRFFIRSFFSDNSARNVYNRQDG